MPTAMGWRSRASPRTVLVAPGPAGRGASPARRSLRHAKRTRLQSLSRMSPREPAGRRRGTRRPRIEAMNTERVSARRTARLETPSSRTDEQRRELTGGLNLLLADLFALYFKTKNFHWHVSGPHFRDYHLMLDQQAEQIFAATDALAERIRKLGATTLHSIGHVA